MPAVSGSQQRLFGMVHAYQKGKLKHAPEKIRRIAKHISEEDAEHFAKTKHDGLPERTGGEKEASSGQPVTVVFGRGRSFTFPSIKAAIVYLQALPGISPADADDAVRNRKSGVGNVKLTYPPPKE